ncbi:patatin family protein [Clostridiaceae bacterium M8S5]|nr:patatin family protein [Clostridiaceae bacterium M8S5]
MEKEKVALVVEGGAMRGIFAAGVLDIFLEKEFNPFDIYIGVSAGAINIASYLAKVYKRNYHIYKQFTGCKECISIKKFIKGGHYFDLDWLWEKSMEKYPLDLEQIYSEIDRSFIVGVTNCNTGNIEYLKPQKDNLENCLKASSAMPVVYRSKLHFNGVRYLDGGLADPIPVKEAYNRGAKEIVVIRSKPSYYKIKPTNKAVRLLFKNLPEVQRALDERVDTYNNAIDFIKQSPEDVKIHDIFPTDDFEVSRFTKDPDVLETGYQIGRTVGKSFLANRNRC